MELRKSPGSIAVFARTKKELHSIRAALAFSGIPTYSAMDNRKNAPLHRMREFMVLITMIKGLEQKTTTAKRLQNEFQVMDCYEKDNPWCRLMDDILLEWESETHNNDRTPAEAVDFIYEAVYERQREHVDDGSVYLSSVHAAKGLEFDHVILLGHWDQPSNAVDIEEERRLYYVGMTRARETLTLCELENTRNPHTHALRCDAVIRSSSGRYLDPPDEVLKVNYVMLDLADQWIAYPIYSPNTRRSISSLRPGTPVRLEKKEDGSRIFILDSDGNRVGALSNSASGEWRDALETIREVRVHSIITWRKDKLDQEPPDNCPDNWELPLLDVVSASDD